MLHSLEIPYAQGYTVNVLGQIFHRGKSIKTQPSKNDGYVRVNLFVDKKYIYRLVHRIVLETFKGPCPKGMESRHLDGIRSNNKLSNLRWGTKQQNQMDKKVHGTLSVNVGSEHPNAKLTEADVAQIKKLLDGGWFQKDIATKYNITQVTVSNIKTGRLWAHV